jgi:hypothetical protein
MHKKEHNDRTSNTGVNDSGKGRPEEFVTILVIG